LLFVARFLREAGDQIYQKRRQVSRVSRLTLLRHATNNRIVDQTARLQHGILLFNQREFFECHEVLEEEWTPERDPRRLFLQSLIHMAVGLYHASRGNPVGASRQLRKGLRKLGGYLPGCEGIDTARLHQEMAETLGRIEAGESFEVPRIHLVSVAGC
jgi:predicted metal-dependent hydrolase